MVKRSLTRSTTTLELASVQRKNPQCNVWSNASRISVVWMCWGWERLSLDSIPRIFWAWLSLWDPLLKSKKGIDNEHGRRIDFWKHLEDCHCSLICASLFGPHLVLLRKRQRTSWGHAAVDFPPKQSLQPSHVPAILNQLYRQTRIWVSPHCLDPSGHQRMPSLAFLCHNRHSLRTELKAAMATIFVYSQKDTQSINMYQPQWTMEIHYISLPISTQFLRRFLGKNTHLLELSSRWVVFQLPETQDHTLVAFLEKTVGVSFCPMEIMEVLSAEIIWMNRV